MSTAGPVSEFTASLLKAVDDLDTEAYLSHLTDDVTVRFGNGAPLHGHDEVRAMLGGHFASLALMRHDVLAEHRVGDVLVQELDVTVERKNGAAGTVPGVNVLRLRDGLVADYRVYIDLSAVDARAPAAH